MQKRTLYPVIMCGGAGTRLWPMSLAQKPKQYHALTSEKTMLQETILRMVDTGNISVAAPSFVCAQHHEEMIYAQARDIGIEPLHIILEPMGRNTAPVAALAADIIHAHDPDGIVLLLPSDHYIKDMTEFWRCVNLGVASAVQGNLVTLGIHPTRPETGYGYIRKGADVSDGLYCVEKFVEKPDLETAQTYVESGDYFWNAGIFLFTPDAMIQSFQTHAPAVLDACRTTLNASTRKDATLFLDPDSFAACPSDSIDYAIMEHAKNIMMVAPIDVGWNDIGSWEALDAFEKNRKSTPNVTPDENVEIGDTLLLDCQDNYVRSDGILVAGVGLENLIIIATKNSVLILPKERGQDVKAIVEKLKAAGRKDLL